jgi:hypothetical protein
MHLMEHFLREISNSLWLTWFVPISLKPIELNNQ